MYTHTCTHTHTHTCMHTHTYTRMHTHNTYTHMYAYTHAHTHTLAGTNPYMGTHCMHIAVLVLFLNQQLLFTEDSATAIYHAFIMLCYLLPILGAIISDSCLGKYA